MVCIQPYIQSRRPHPQSQYTQADEKTAQIETVLAKLPMPIIHNKRLAEILLALIAKLQPGTHQYRKPDHLEIITCHDYDRPSLFEISLDRLGIQEYTVLKEPFRGPWRNTYKLRWVLNHLEQNPHGPAYVLFCDADDTILKANPQAVVEIFLAKQCQLLFMSTSFTGGYACMPEVKQWSDRIFPGRYLNSGVYIGRRNFLISVLREAHHFITENDITAEESRLLGHGVNSKALCRRLPEYPKGCQDQDILRYLHPKFYPHMQIDYDNQLAFRNI